MNEESYSELQNSILREEIRNIEIADAWFAYRETTQSVVGIEYDEVEGWAWQKLQNRLGELSLKNTFSEDNSIKKKHSKK